MVEVYGNTDQAVYSVQLSAGVLYGVCIGSGERVGQVATQARMEPVVVLLESSVTERCSPWFWQPKGRTFTVGSTTLRVHRKRTQRWTR